MAVDPAAVAQHLSKLFQSAFDGQKTGRYTISKAALRLLADGTPRLEDTTLTKVINSAYINHDLVLFPLDGTVGSAKTFGVMKTGPLWRRVPDAVVKAVAQS